MNSNGIRLGCKEQGRDAFVSLLYYAARANERLLPDLNPGLLDLIERDFIRRVYTFMRGDSIPQIFGPAHSFLYPLPQYRYFFTNMLQREYIYINCFTEYFARYG